MDSTEHFRDPSNDEGEDIKYRECDDMLQRRLGGNLPAPLRKKKNETYKQFITPTGNPMSYVREHMRSKSVSELQVENAEKEVERDERNSRYEEMQQLKVMLKEEEDTWTSKLDNWKQKRRSITFDVRKRKEDRDTVEQRTSISSIRRKPKTYREMLEDKKRRESELFDEEDNLSPRLNLSNEHTFDDVIQENGYKSPKKSAYKGAMSVPNFTETDLTFENLPPAVTKVEVSPVTRTPDVAPEINHVATESEDSSDLSKDDSQLSDSKPDELAPTKTNQPKVSEMVSTIFNKPAHSSPPQKNTWKQFNATPSTFNKTSTFPPQQIQARSQSPPPRNSYSSAAGVKMRGNETKRERPKSEYMNRASTLPRNYHQYSAPKPFVAGKTTFAQYRKTSFANKRNMWETIRFQEPERRHLSGPLNLSELLQHDSEQLQQGAQEPEKPLFNGINNDMEDVDISPRERFTIERPKQETFHQQVETDNAPEPESVQTKHEPIIRSWQSHSKQSDAKPNFRRVNAAVPNKPAGWTKSATLPSRHPPAELKIITKNKEEEKLSPNDPRLRDSSPKSKLKSPRLPSSGMELFDDMKICINQRPKSERGFGFTVRGGDEGKPVIVNTVSPGGAAESCQLCVGDEILAINDVRLTSSLTQDSIVQLIVDSVFTGNLSLDIRRYGKVKKANPSRLASAKVVMANGGFVQIRSDRGKSLVVSTKPSNEIPSNTINQNHKPPDAPEDMSVYDLPLPPPPPDLEHPKKESAVSRLSPMKPPPTRAQHKTTSPLSDLIQSAKLTTVKAHAQPHHSQESSVGDELGDDNQFNDNYDSKLQQELEMEETYLSHERQKFERDDSLKMQLLEEQRTLEEREAKREEEKRKRIEEAKLEELRLEEELRKIEAKKLEQQKKREEERKRLFEDRSDSGSRVRPSFNQGGINHHWLIEEAERSRLADQEGRNRLNPLDYSIDNATSPNHVTQELHGQPQRNAQARNPHLTPSLANHWNNPSTRATLL